MNAQLIDRLCALYPALQSLPPSVTKTNVGGIDRILRIVLGLALVALTLTGTIGAWGWVGVVPMLTGALGICPIYTMLGCSSCPVKTR